MFIKIFLNLLLGKIEKLKKDFQLFFKCSENCFNRKLKEYFHFNLPKIVVDHLYKKLNNFRYDFASYLKYQ